MARLVKFIYDDREPGNEGWIVREYLDGEQTTEYHGVLEARDAKIQELVEAHLLIEVDTDFELYRSISDSQPAETY